MAEWKDYDRTTFTDFGSVGETMPASPEDMGGDGDRTMPVDDSIGFGMSAAPTVPDDGNVGDTESNPWGTADTSTVFDHLGVTNEDGEKVRPATGWLVCIKGKTKGTDYRLYEGYSYVGRDPAKNQVAIPDDHISSVPSARILYDTDSRRFFINECNGARNPGYLNEQLFDGRVELKAYDIIRLGNTKLLFVPLCTDKFAWEE